MGPIEQRLRAQVLIKNANGHRRQQREKNVKGCDGPRLVQNLAGEAVVKGEPQLRRLVARRRTRHEIGKEKQRP